LETVSWESKKGDGMTLDNARNRLIGCFQKPPELSLPSDSGRALQAATLDVYVNDNSGPDPIRPAKGVEASCTWKEM
jgi:hypothetical protein